MTDDSANAALRGIEEFTARAALLPLTVDAWVIFDHDGAAVRMDEVRRAYS